jgi:hypothetical protein
MLALLLLLSSILPSGFAQQSSISIPRIDELSWAKLVNEKRHSDYDDVQTGARVLLLRPQFRNAYLQSGDIDTFIKQHYTTSAESADEKWADEQRQMLATVHMKSAKSLSPANYSEKFWVGYRNNDFRGRAGNVCYKVFLELKDPLKDLTPSQYVRFAEYLSAKGFVGDSKIPVAYGQLRFQYNNVIIHAASMEHALYAESLGKEFFGNKLAGTARGIDSYLTSEPQDWHHYLASNKGELNGLSYETNQYLNYTVKDPWTGGAGAPQGQNNPRGAAGAGSASTQQNASASHAATTNALTSRQQQDLDDAQRQADEILARAKQQAATYDSQAARTARDMQHTPAAGRGSFGRTAYSDEAIQSATQEMRDQSNYVLERAEREAADVMRRARLRAGLPVDN